MGKHNGENLSHITLLKYEQLILELKFDGTKKCASVILFNKLCFFVISLTTYHTQRTINSINA